MNNDQAKQTDTPGASDSEMLLDGKMIPVTFRPVAKGQPPTPGMEIKVRKIPICDMEPLGRAFGKNLPEVACYLDRDEEFVRTLSDESFIAAMSEGRRLNFMSFKKWWEWQEQTLDALGQKEAGESLVAKVVEKLTAANQKAQAAKSASASAASS